MKKIGKIIFKTLLTLVILGGIGYGGYTLYQSNQKSGQAETVKHTPTTITTGNIEKAVSGTGSLSISQTNDLTLDYPVTVDEVLVRSGEEVTTGEALMKINQAALENTISELEEEYNTYSENIASAGGGYSSDENVKSTASGRIKALYAKQGDNLSEVMNEFGAIALLSLDGKMNVTITDEGGALALGDSVKVKIEAGSYTGEVQKIEGNQVTITFSDSTILEGEEVTVSKEGQNIGSGQAHINMPFNVISDVNGRVASVVLEVNNTVTARTTLYKAGQIPIPQEYHSLLKEQQELKEVIEDAKGLLEQGKILSTIDGIVESTLSAGEVAEKGSVLASLYVGDAKEMVVSVDELDITTVEVGQPVTIQMDAVTDKTYSGTVAYISQIGNNASGVTTYNVTIDVQGDEQLKMGMNGTATIKVETVENVPLVPISALNSSINGQYVWLYNEEAAGDDASGLPGILTYVTTGLSDANYAEVTSGLKEGDQVLITRNAASTGEQNGMAMTMMDPGMFMEGGEMPAMPQNFDGVTFPGGGASGGGERPSGGGARPSGGN